MHVESTADTVEDLHGRRLLVTAPRRRRDFFAEYPPRAPRAGGGDSLRCRPSRPGHDGMETGLRHHSKADLSRSGAVRTSLLALPLSSAAGGACAMRRWDESAAPSHTARVPCALARTRRPRPREEAQRMQHIAFDAHK